MSFDEQKSLWIFTRIGSSIVKINIFLNDSKIKIQKIHIYLKILFFYYFFLFCQSLRVTEKLRKAWQTFL